MKQLLFSITVLFLAVVFMECLLLVFSDPSLQFPKQYPTGCLLGSVEVKDCLAEDDYRKMVGSTLTRKERYC